MLPRLAAAVAVEVATVVDTDAPQPPEPLFALWKLSKKM